MTGVYEWMIEMFTDLATHPAQCESKEQGCSTTLERGAGVDFWPQSGRREWFQLVLTELDRCPRMGMALVWR